MTSAEDLEHIYDWNFRTKLAPSGFVQDARVLEQMTNEFLETEDR